MFDTGVEQSQLSRAVTFGAPGGKPQQRCIGPSLLRVYEVRKYRAVPHDLAPTVTVSELRDPLVPALMLRKIRELVRAAHKSERDR